METSEAFLALLPARVMYSKTEKQDHFKVYSKYFTYLKNDLAYLVQVYIIGRTKKIFPYKAVVKSRHCDQIGPSNFPFFNFKAQGCTFAD